MKRTDHVASIAIAGALAVHAVLLYAALEAEARGWGNGYRTGWPVGRRVVAAAVPVGVPAEAKIPLNPVVPEFVMGEAGGAGESVNRDDAAVDQAAPTSAELAQAWQVHEKAGDAQAADPAKPSDPGDEGKSGRAELAAPEFTSAERSVRTQAETTLTSRKPYKKIDPDHAHADPAERKPDTGGSEPVVPEERTAARESPARDPGQAATDPPEAKAGDPGAQAAHTVGRPVPESDRDADIVSKKFDAKFTKGRVIVQAGRVVKFASPQRHLAATVDGWAGLSRRRIVLKITIDAAGHVRKADVVKGCGAASIDRAFVLAAYDSWFEPTKDRNGQPVGDDFEFPIDLL